MRPWSDFQANQLKTLANASNQPAANLATIEKPRTK